MVDGDCLDCFAVCVLEEVADDELRCSQQINPSRQKTAMVARRQEIIGQYCPILLAIVKAPDVLVSIQVGADFSDFSRALSSSGLLPHRSSGVHLAESLHVRWR